MHCSMPDSTVLHFPWACSNPCPLSQWCYPTISFSVAPFPFCQECLPTSGSFPVSQLFASGGQSIGTSASTSFLPMNSQGWFPLGLTSFISLFSKGLSRVFCSTTIGMHQFFSAQPSLWFNSHIVHDYWRKQFWLYFVGKVMSLVFNILSRFVIAFLQRSKCLVISWLQSLSAVIFAAQENKICHCFHFFPFYFPWSDGTRCHVLNFQNVEL